MSAIFRNTDKDYLVISPVGYISPVSFVTKKRREFKAAKVIYNVCAIITFVLLAWHYRSYNGVADPMKWPSLIGIFIGAHIVIYLSLIHI